jgi:hypothetical protein
MHTEIICVTMQIDISPKDHSMKVFTCNFPNSALDIGAPLCHLQSSLYMFCYPQASETAFTSVPCASPCNRAVAVSVMHLCVVCTEYAYYSSFPIY